jgi:hypothetical protein
MGSHQNALPYALTAVAVETGREKLEFFKDSSESALATLFGRGEHKLTVSLALWPAIIFPAKGLCL